jgi:hypothetical protein
MSNAKLGIKCSCGAVAVVCGGRPSVRRCLCRSCGNRFDVSLKDAPDAPKRERGIKAGPITIGSGFRWGSTRLG